MRVQEQLIHVLFKFALFVHPPKLLLKILLKLMKLTYSLERLHIILVVNPELKVLLIQTALPPESPLFTQLQLTAGNPISHSA